MAHRSPSARTYRIDTLGCKANLYDSQRLAEALEALGLRPAEEAQAPDVCIVNTCTVTSVADRKSRQRASRLAREFPSAEVYVTGCYAAAEPADLAAVQGVRGVFGRKDWPALLEAVGRAPMPEAAVSVEGEFGICSFAGRGRAFLKIQEGCDSFCSYCILPQVRGRPQSRPLDDVAAEARRLAENGFREVVLTGIHLGLYGADQPADVTLADAVRVVAATDGIERVRLSSLEPNEVDEALLEAMRHPAVCRHLHLPLQSGDDGVLRLMNRRYTADAFLRAVETVRQRLDRAAVTTDVIVGFPGEGDEQFARTMHVCREAAFSRLHVFPFSPRAGTPAATMPDRPPAAVAQERSRALRDLGQVMAEQWAESFVGGTVRVLFERRSPAGRLSGYIDRYVRLSADGPEELVGRVAAVACSGRRGAVLVGRLA